MGTTDRRRYILSNQYESLVAETLENATRRHGARFYPKVRVADALAIDHSGLTNEEYGYALKSHFDFVVADRSSKTLFAVEYDGPQHRHDPTTLRRDALKDSICSKLGMPLLRTDAWYLEEHAGFKLLGWLVETWFLWRDFKVAQARGELPPDQEFDVRFVQCLGYVEGDRYVEADTADPRAHVIFPFDLGAPALGYIKGYFFKELTLDVLPIVTYQHSSKREMSAEALVRVPGGQVVRGHARCRLIDFLPVTHPLLLAHDLALIDLRRNLREWVRGDRAAEPWTGPPAPDPSETRALRSALDRAMHQFSLGFARSTHEPKRTSWESHRARTLDRVTE